MIGKKTNEIAGCARDEAGRETEIGEKAHKSAFLYAGEDGGWRIGEIPKSKDQAPEKLQSPMLNKHLFPALVASTASRGERDDCEGPILEKVRPHPGLLPQEKENVSDASGLGEPVEPASAAGLSDVAAADPADTAPRSGDDDYGHDYDNQ